MFGKRNFIILGIGIAVLIIGFILLGQGPVRNPLSWIVAPVLLILGYIVILPLAVILRDPGQKQEDNTGV